MAQNKPVPVFLIHILVFLSFPTSETRLNEVSFENWQRSISVALASVPGLNDVDHKYLSSVIKPGLYEERFSSLFTWSSRFRQNDVSPEFLLYYYCAGEVENTALVHTFELDSIAIAVALTETTYGGACPDTFVFSDSIQPLDRFGTTHSLSVAGAPLVVLTRVIGDSIVSQIGNPNEQLESFLNQGGL